MSYLASLLSQLSEKQEQLSRLKACESDLKKLQGEFSEFQKLVKEPELSATTWMGNLANTFQDFREDADKSYKDVSNTQLNTALQNIGDKIVSITEEIESLESQIEAERARMEVEQEQNKG
ncbi:DUF5082 family protein [Metabacillus fastidiosus]|uniref:YwqH-like family protein n=1 Tax=Metabacillus fastidiosus TaxID=1458 RepID=UPI002E210181|nr:DUF5082 family protein [Metabacillus fastidiosus]